MPSGICVQTPQFKDCMLAIYMALTKEYCSSFGHVINPRKNNFGTFSYHKLLISWDGATSWREVSWHKNLTCIHSSSHCLPFLYC
jgi:hypothetical protein